MANGPFYDVGLHTGVITRQSLTKASTGNMQAVIGVKILGIPQGEVSFEPHRAQYERTIYWTITEKTMPFIVEKLKTLDFKGTKFSQIDPSSPEHVSMIHQQVDLWCKHEERQDGSVGEKWDISNGGGQKEYTPLAAKELRQLDSLFGKALAEKSPPKKQTPNDDPGITDEDIPF